MEENETLVRYIATILMGDEYHKEGEEHILSSWEIENTKKYGLRLQVSENNRWQTFYHLYPCSIRKITYKITPIEIETVEGGDRSNPMLYKSKGIGIDWTGPEYDWTEHWP